MEVQIDLKLYAVQSKDGKWLRAKGYSGSGNSWVENIEDALKFALMGADVLQLEKFPLPLLSDAVKILRTQFSHIMLMATGGITLKNIQEYAGCGVDVIVTSSPYNASPADIKVRIEPL